MDECDRAYEFEQDFLQKALAAHQTRRDQRLHPRAVPGVKVYCEECGNEIPAARLTAIPGCRLCVKCAAALEREN